MSCEGVGQTIDIQSDLFYSFVCVCVWGGEWNIGRACQAI